jgi:hypothetical protein
MRKPVALLLVTMLAALAFSMSCFMVLKAFGAESPSPTPDINAPIPIPSVPEFNLKYVDHSYDVPPTTTSHTDPYTGKVTTETHPGYHVENFTIDLTIENQAFPASIDGFSLGMRYFIEAKGHFEEEWHRQANIDTQSSSGYTIVSFPAKSYAGGTVDFRVKAWLGFYYPGDAMVPAWYLWPRSSDWSNTQTITIPESQTSPPSTLPTPTPNQTPSPSQEPSQTLQFEAVVGLAIAVVVIGGGLGLLLYLIKRK